MLPDFAFFPQLFSPAKIVVAYSSDKPTPGSFADSANQYALAHPSLNAFSITSFNYSVEAPGCGDDASGVSAAAPGTLWNSNALDNYPPYASPPPCEGSYVRITTMGEPRTVVSPSLDLLVGHPHSAVSLHWKPTLQARRLASDGVETTCDADRQKFQRVTKRTGVGLDCWVWLLGMSSA